MSNGPLDLSRSIPGGTTAVFAVVVTFRPVESLLSNLNLLLSQVDHVAIVDNGSPEPARRILQQAASLPNVTVIQNQTNEGIARAFNQGLDNGLSQGYEWLIIFDQDSTVTSGMVQALLRCFDEPAAGIAAPAYVDRQLGSRLGEDRYKSGEVRTVLSSGMLLPRSVLERVGLMEERLFIDSVDHEFCARVRNCGYRIVQTGEATLLHSLGRLTQLNLLGRTFTVTNHSAARKYYQTRNRLWTLGRPCARRMWWSQAALEAKSMLWDYLKVLLAEEDRWRKTRLMLRGVWHAIRGQMGKTVEP